MNRFMVLGITALLVLGGMCPANADSDTAAGPVAMRRLTQEQYRQILADVFGPTVRLGGRFEPDIRDAGLLAVGASEVSVTASGLEQYDSMARGIASQVVDARHRALLIPCRPASETDPDDTCARQFLGKVGRLLYRRPLTEHELSAQVIAAHAAARATKSFYDGLGLALAGMMDAPQFLFRQEVVEPDPDHAGVYRLDAFSKATRLAFFLWNAAPDPELLAAAESGALGTKNGLERQVDRMLASSRVESGTRAFFSDMLGYDGFQTLAKDTTLFPKFTPDILADAQEQTLRTIIDHLMVRKADYRDLFTTHRTFLTPLLASIYRVRLVFPPGEPNAWLAYDYPSEAQEAGILTDASFVALHSQPGRSSATVRGKALREVLLCQKVPDPPGNVNFNLVQDTANPNYKTARQRLRAHATQATCVGCHKLMDPVGLALENFDTIGGFRDTENGAPIDASGELDSVNFTDVAGLGKAVHDNSATTACIVNRVYEFAAGHKPNKAESEWMRGDMQKRFAASGYQFPELLRAVATSDIFYRALPPRTGELDVPSAKLASGPNTSQERQP
jgi:hypothetical protein